MWSADEASRALGIEVLELGIEAGGPTPLGHARTRMEVGQAMVNGHDIAHGGYLFTLADSTFALACNATGQLTVAAGADITFVAPSRLGDVLVAEARERVRYGRSGVTDVTITRESDGAVIAEFRGRSRSLPPR
ncbi:hydroxyphenylacetyl-CoA thioesterase PaaI [Ornithinimicrobium pratense]|uniref:Hydroxyphenylacetyl-CoA thioesterase PaaI n=2 Tax=Ornithinimicrobium pratense TaxID=2593973 RepID=A0A5J6V7K8_9MICO|nr:hydroxyphenylacetyl-CoA thioesterase PaaI [Ornithinimicrobium pratense]